MIRPGLASISFRKLNCREVAALAKRAGLEGIEWIGDAHVPAGDVAKAREAAAATREAGLAVAGYGSYFRPGEKREDIPEFEAVLEAAVALGTPIIRGWAGLRGSKDADEAYRGKVVDDLRRADEKAAKAGIRIALEYHAHTLTDTDESAWDLLQRLQGTGVAFYWQPHFHNDVNANAAALQRLCNTGKVLNLHLFHWLAKEGGYDRRPLADGAAAWTRYLRIPDWNQDRFALLEFVRDDRPEQCVEDAATLRAWLADIARGGRAPA